MGIHFILVNPRRGENVGFSARALMTMGYRSLRIVGSSEILQGVARKTAYGSHAVLDSAQVYEDLSSALEDVDLAVGTTSKARIKRYDLHSPRELATLIKDKGTSSHNIALIFGSEENGLTTGQLDICDQISTIPLSTRYPSLNLAQSVLIYAYELAGLQSSPNMPLSSLNKPLQAQLKQQSEQLLKQLNLDKKPLLKRRILDRLLGADADDMELMMLVINKINRRWNEM